MLRNISILLFIGALIIVPVLMVGVSIESNLYFALIVVGYLGTLIFSLLSAIKKDKKWLFASLVFVSTLIFGVVLDDQDRVKSNSDGEMGFHQIERN